MATAKTISKAKIATVKELSEALKNARTIMVVSIKGLRSKQFQEIKKSLRGHAHVTVAKKSLMIRSLESMSKDSLKPLSKYINENSAFVISNEEGFSLAGMISQKKTLAFAKAGQISPTDIEVSAGPTDLVPGPAISELGAVGIQIAVEDGKISIKAPKIVVREGQEITEAVASLLQKLHIQPFSIGLIPLALYDTTDDKVYSDIHIDSEEALSALRVAASKALGFAQKIGYVCAETIGYFLSKAKIEGDVLSSLEGAEKPAEEKVDSAEEENPEESSGDEAPKEEKKEVSEHAKEDTPERKSEEKNDG